MGGGTTQLEFEGTSRFRALRRIGAGGMGVVYEVYDSQLAQIVALKTLREVDPQNLLFLKNEFRALQDIRHPNLVDLGELIEDQGRWFFTMELIDGIDLLRYVRPDATSDDPLTSETTIVDPAVRPSSPGTTTIPEPQALAPVAFDELRLRRALAQLASALHTLHQAGKVHRDVKPSNVLVEKSGRVVLLDFGVIADLSHGARAEGQMIGTAAYMAPEQIAAGEISPAADWYALGVVLYEALTGRVPFIGSNLQIFQDKQHLDPLAPSLLVRDPPDDLDQLCRSLLRSDAKARPSGDEILRQLLGERSVSESRPTSSSYFGRAPFVGRQAELQILEGAYQACCAGESQIVIVEADSGLGKSALIEKFIGDKRDLELRPVVLAGRCYERESVPYKGFDRVVDELATHLRGLTDKEVEPLLPTNAALLKRIFPVLGRVTAIARARAADIEPTDRELRDRVFTAMRELLTRLAREQPLILVVDDFQWSDTDSRLLLEELCRPPHPPALLLVLASRLAGTSSLFSPDSPLGAAENVRRVELQPLDSSASLELARQLLEKARLRGTAITPDEIVGEAGGHPLYIDELVRHAALSVESSERPAGRVRLEDAIWMRASHLPPTARKLLELVAVAGAPLGAETIRYAAEVSQASFAKELGLLRVAKLVRSSGSLGPESLEPYHDRIRESVLANLGDENRIERHQRLVIALESGGVDRPELLMQHLEGAGDRLRAAACAEEAAKRAYSGLAFDQAAHFYEAAIRLGDHRDEVLRQLRIARAHALSMVGHGREAAQVYLAAAEGADLATRRECHRHAAEQLLITGHLEEGLAAVNALLAEIGVTLAKSPGGALASLLWTRVKLRLRGYRWQRRHIREIADSELARHDIFQVVASGLAMIDNIRGADFGARALLMALKLGEPSRIVKDLAMEAIFQSSQGGRGARRGGARLLQLRQIASDSAHPYAHAWTAGCEGAVSYFAGEFAESDRQLALAESRFSDLGEVTTFELNSVRLFRMLDHRHMGRIAAWRLLSGDYGHDAHRRGDLYAKTSMTLVGTLLLLADDRPREVYEVIEQARWRPPVGGFHVQHWYRLEAEAEVALYQRTVPR